MMASLEAKIRFEREGLIIHCWIDDKPMPDINLQEFYGLSDDNAAYVLKKLDEKDREKE
jgi:hypothetical protein